MGEKKILCMQNLKIHNIRTKQKDSTFTPSSNRLEFRNANSKTNIIKTKQQKNKRTNKRHSVTPEQNRKKNQKWKKK